MNVIKYALGFFGWKSEQASNPNPISDTHFDFVIIENENAPEPKMSFSEFIRATRYESDSDSDPDFDQKLMNRKNYNQKKSKIRKQKKR
jgi:hypothetical protein